MRSVVFVVCCAWLITLSSCGNNNPSAEVPIGLHGEKYITSIQDHRDQMNAFFMSANSPLEDSMKASFTGLHFFDIDSQFRIKAEYEKITDGPVFKMEVSGSIADYYQTVGKLHFKVSGKDEVLEVYENQSLKSEGVHLNFVPFNDLTNGSETYSGGRYIDIPAISGATVTLDFNFAYQPYCAYNHSYSCPIPTPANKLDVAVRAGERL